MANMKARKILTLIKFARLNYTLEEIPDPEADKEHLPPFLLKTTQGELHEEYEIIHFIVSESRRLSQTEEKSGNDSFKELPENEADDHEQRAARDSQIVSLCVNDNYLLAKMQEQLVSLRMTLFPML